MRAAGKHPAAHAAPAQTRVVPGLGSIAGHYKGLLLDQFGVLHDGRKPYPHAVEAVSAAAAAGLQLLLISNSSRRAGGTLDKLAKMGFDRSAFAGLITSGELTHRLLSGQSEWRRCLHINWATRGPIRLDDAYGLEAVLDPAQADFILAHGTEGVTLPGGDVEPRRLEELEGLLRGAAAVDGRSLPLVLANPDLVTVDGGDLVTMPGSLAAAYAAAGGPVISMGKPAAVMYEAAEQELGLPLNTLCAVGDSLQHDIAGAINAGVDSLFIGGGIHAKEAFTPDGTALSSSGLEQLFKLHLPPGSVPTYSAGWFRW